MVKTGRKQKSHVCSWTGLPVAGLYRGPNNRWRITATGERFTEHDERKAIARFHQMESRRRGSEALLTLPLVPEGPLADDDGTDAALAVLRHELGTGEHRAPADDSLVLRIPEGTDPVQLLRAIPEDVLWNYVGEQIHDRPKDIAARTGHEWIAYGPTLEKPKPSPKLSEVWELFSKAKTRSRDWQWKCETFWQDFCDMIGVNTVREITQDMVKPFS